MSQSIRSPTFRPPSSVWRFDPISFLRRFRSISFLWSFCSISPLIFRSFPGILVLWSVRSTVPLFGTFWGFRPVSVPVRSYVRDCFHTGVGTLKQCALMKLSTENKQIDIDQFVKIIQHYKTMTEAIIASLL